MDESHGEEGTDSQGITTPGTEQLQSNLDYDSNDESPSAAGGTRDCTPDHTQASAFDDVLSYIHELQESQRQLEESYEILRASYQQDYGLILEALEEEQSRCDYLEQRLTDVTELIQKEVWNMEKELATKETFVDQPYDTTQDFIEVLQSCETRLFKLEQQQQQQQEETMQPERWTNTTHLLGKLINVPLAIMAVLLVLVSTVASCVVLFVKTSHRMLCTLLFLILLCFLWRHQEVILDHLFIFRHSSWK